MPVRSDSGVGRGSARPPARLTGRRVLALVILLLSVVLLAIIAVTAVVAR
jgi:hypothetical protein